MALFGFEPRRSRHFLTFLCNKNPSISACPANMCKHPHRCRFFAVFDYVRHRIVPDLRRGARVRWHRVADTQRDVLIGMAEALGHDGQRHALAE